MDKRPKPTVHIQLAICPILLTHFKKSLAVSLIALLPKGAEKRKIPTYVFIYKVDYRSLQILCDSIRFFYNPICYSI